MIEHSTTIRAGIKKYIHIDQGRNAANKKDGGDRPVYAIQVPADGTSYKCHSLKIKGETEWVGNGKKLSCGAIHYGITHAEIVTTVRQ